MAFGRTQPSNHLIINPHIVLFTSRSQQLGDRVEEDKEGHSGVKNKQSTVSPCLLGGGGWGRTGGRCGVI